jgi:lysophospholipid acyltransferase
MMVTLRLTSLAFCLKDGDSKIKDPAASLTKRQTVYRVEDTPSLLEYLSYSFASSGCVLGPHFEYNDYTNFINLKGHYSNAPL